MPMTMRVKAVSIDKNMRRAMRNMPGVMHEFAGWTIEQADPYVPYRTGALSASAHVEDSSHTFARRPGAHKKERTPATHYASSVVYDQPYARHLYFGLRHQVFGFDARTAYRKAKERAQKTGDYGDFIQYSTKVHSQAQAFWYFGAQMDHLREYEAKMAELVLKELKRK